MPHLITKTVQWRYSGKGRKTSATIMEKKSFNATKSFSIIAGKYNNSSCFIDFLNKSYN